MTVGKDQPFEGDDRQYSPTRLPGWLQEVTGPDRVQPEQLTMAQLRDLPPRQLLRHNDRRNVWHANIGPIQTPTAPQPARRSGGDPRVEPA